MMGKTYMPKAMIQGIILTCLIIQCAKASTSIDATNKHSWSENIGWVNVAPTNGGVTLHFNGTIGHLTGLAWGENIGWIKLGTDSGGPYSNDCSTNWGVNLDTAGKLTGYAWGENVGWIKFNIASNLVTIDMTTGRFDGFAWGENIGWIHLKGSSPDYNVRTIAFDKQSQGTPNWWLQNYDVTEDYDAGDGVPAWKKYIMDTNPKVEGDYLCITAISNLPPATVTFLSSARRYYTLQRCDDLKAGDWTNVVTQIGNPSLTSLQDTTATTQGAYRVEVKMTP